MKARKNTKSEKTLTFGEEAAIKSARNSFFVNKTFSVNNSFFANNISHINNIFSTSNIFPIYDTFSISNIFSIFNHKDLFFEPSIFSTKNPIKFTIKKPKKTRIKSIDHYMHKLATEEVNNEILKSIIKDINHLSPFRVVLSENESKKMQLNPNIFPLCISNNYNSIDEKGMTHGYFESKR